MRKQYTLAVTLTLVGPLFTAGSETAEPGIDSPLAKDRHGRYMLPFSLIKGKVLDALVELFPDEFERDAATKRPYPKPSSRFADWLGKSSADGQYEPERGRIRFGDLSTDKRGTSGNVIQRIQIDGDTRAVCHRMIQMIEAPFGYGEAVDFVGKVEYLADDQEAEEIANKLTMAMRWVPMYGAFRTVGFGRTKQVDTALAASPVTHKGKPTVGKSLPLRLTLDRPLCIVGQKHSWNHFDSLEVISGTVLKGAVARLLQELSGSRSRDVTSIPTKSFPKLCEHFAAIRFAEARPMKVDGQNMRRPTEPPLSIATCPLRDGEIFDAALAEEPFLIYSTADELRQEGAAPAFLPDWKGADYSRVRSYFGWSQLPRERRTRTAINPTTGRAADEQLFSYGLVLPDRTDEHGISESFVWEGSIGLDSIPSDVDRQSIASELYELLQFGLPNIGKTRAVAAVQWLATATPSEIGSASLPGDLLAITLQTECLMTNPDTLQADTADVMRAAYEEFWSEVSKGCLSLVRYFARQSLYGGFVSRRANNKKYEPFLLTDRGSVFVLQILDRAQAESLLKQWQQQGLPIAPWVHQRYAGATEPLWQRCPYLPTNGYGEIAVDLACHTQFQYPPVATTVQGST